MSNSSNHHDDEDIRLKQQLQCAIRQTAIPPGLEDRVRACIDAASRHGSAGRPRLTLQRWMMAAAAVIVVGAGLAIVDWQFGSLGVVRTAEDSFIASVSRQVPSRLLQVGLHDHLHCAAFRKFSKNPPPVEVLAAAMDPRERGVLRAVERHIPAGCRVMEAHRCRYKARRYLHLALAHDSHVLSVVITAKQPGERLDTQELSPAIPRSGARAVPLYAASARQFQIAAFESDGHVVYLISDLPKRENLQMLAALSDSLREAVLSMES